MKKQLTLTEKHLDAALAAPWSTTTCLIAQALGGPEALHSCSTEGAVWKGLEDTPIPSLVWSDMNAKFLQQNFDRAGRDLQGPDPQSRELRESLIAEVRAELPYTFEITELRPPPKLHTITEEHLDKALSLPFRTTTCVVAQSFITPGLENRGCEDATMLWFGPRFGEYKATWSDPRVRRVQRLHDDARDVARENLKAAIDMITELRAMLPLTFVLDSDDRPRVVAITEEHLDAALAVRWSTSTCLIAQAFGGPDKVVSCGSTVVTLRDEAALSFDSAAARTAQGMFDNIRYTKDDTTKAALIQSIRVMLPITFIATPQIPQIRL